MGKNSEPNFGFTDEFHRILERNNISTADDSNLNNTGDGNTGKILLQIYLGIFHPIVVFFLKVCVFYFGLNFILSDVFQSPIHFSFLASMISVFMISYVLIMPITKQLKIINEKNNFVNSK